MQCHRRYSGFGPRTEDPKTRDPDNAGGICVRHPNTESIRGAREAINQHEGGSDPVHWVNGSNYGPNIGFSIDRLPFIVSGPFSGDASNNYSAATAVASNNEVFCLTCHKAHGSEYNSSMRWPYQEDGSNLGCQQCHNKGS